MNRELLFKIYWKIQSVIAPGLKSSQKIYEEVLNENIDESLKLKWLDLGCGHQVLPQWMLDQEKSLVKKAKLIVGVDYDFLSLTKHETIKNKLRGDIAQLPFPDNTFDLVTSNMVFEHLNCPEKQLKEICRVLSKGGKLIFHTPNKLSYATLLARMLPDCIKPKLVYILQNRKEEDVFPAFYRINSISQIHKTAKLVGFNVLKIKLLCSSAQFVVLPPLAVLELIYIRLLMFKAGRLLRTNIIAILEKV